MVRHLHRKTRKRKTKAKARKVKSVYTKGFDQSRYYKKHFKKYFANGLAGAAAIALMPALLDSLQRSGGLPIKTDYKAPDKVIPDPDEVDCEKCRRLEWVPLDMVQEFNCADCEDGDKYSPIGQKRAREDA